MSRVITGHELRSHRMLRGMSQAEVAERLHVNQKTVANWEASQVPGSREADVRDEVLFEDSLDLVRAIPTEVLAAEVTRRLLEASEGNREDKWVGYAPPRRRRRRDTPDDGNVSKS